MGEVQGFWDFLARGVARTASRGFRKEAELLRQLCRFHAQPLANLQGVFCGQVEVRRVVFCLVQGDRCFERELANVELIERFLRR